MLFWLICAIPLRLSRFGVDTRRIAMAGHSMGGWVVAHTAAHDHGLIGAVLISAGDMGRVGELPSEKAAALMADNMESLAGVTAESMAAEVKERSKEFRMENAATGLAQMPLLAITSDDGLAPDTDALVKEIKAKGGHNVTVMHMATDHSYSDHRIALESAVITWLGGLR
jgi:acetyl esterase/lipase